MVVVCVTDDGVHSLQLQEGRSAVVNISSPRKWKVLVSLDGGLEVAARAGSPPPPQRGAPSKTEHVEKIEKKKKNRMRPLSGPLKQSVSLTIAHQARTSRAPA